MEPCYNRLIKNLIEAFPLLDDCYNQWAKEMATTNPRKIVLDIEKDRAALLKMVKDCADLKQKTFFTGDEAFIMLNRLIRLDRANALFKMKIVRDDLSAAAGEKCPDGFIWATQEEFDKHGYADIVQWKGVKSKASITSKYWVFAKLNEFSNEQLNQIEELLQTQMPRWIKDNDQFFNARMGVASKEE